MRSLRYPRWEDFNYDLPDGIKNRMHWLGDGQTYNEKTMTGDRKLSTPSVNEPHSCYLGAWYLNDDELDIPPGTRLPSISEASTR